MSAKKGLVIFRWFGKIVPLCFFVLDSLRRRREDGITFLEIICHVRFVSGYLFFPILFLHSLQCSSGNQHLQMPVSHLEIRRVNTGMDRCKTHELSRVNFLFFSFLSKGESISEQSEWCSPHWWNLLLA